jgi:hypothetical protein
MPPSIMLNAEYRPPERALKPSRPPAADAFSAIVAAAEMFDSLAESCIGTRNRFLEHARSPTTGSAKKQAPDWLEEMHLSKARELEHVMTTIEQLEAALGQRQQWLAMRGVEELQDEPVVGGLRLRSRASASPVDGWRPTESSRERVATRVEERLFNAHLAAEEEAARVRAAHPPPARRKPRALSAVEEINSAVDASEAATAGAAGAAAAEKEAAAAYEAVMRDAALVAAARAATRGASRGSAQPPYTALHAGAHHGASRGSAQPPYTAGAEFEDEFDEYDDEYYDEIESPFELSSISFDDAPSRALSTLTALSALGTDVSPPAREAARALVAAAVRPPSAAITAAATSAAASAAAASAAAASAERRAVHSSAIAPTAAPHSSGVAPTAAPRPAGASAMLASMLLGGSGTGSSGTGSSGTAAPVPRATSAAAAVEAAMGVRTSHRSCTWMAT